MSQPPTPGRLYLIVNKQLNLSWHVSGQEKIHGIPPQEELSQKWQFEYDGKYWTIKNVLHKKFANLEPGESALPGVQLAATIPREWELCFDEELDGWRIIDPESKLSVEIAAAHAPPRPDHPVILAKPLPEGNQIWRFVH